MAWFFKSRFERLFSDDTAPIRAWVEAIGELADFLAERFDRGDNAALRRLQSQEANLLQAYTLSIRHGWWDPTLSSMQGLLHTHLSVGRWGQQHANRLPNCLAIEALGVEAADIVLELGCGPGR